MALVPTVLEQTGRGERAYDIFSRLLRDNIIFIGTPINDDIANLIIAQMLFCTSETPEKPIRLYINSPGGSITAGMAIFDTMQYIPNDVETVCVGQAFSMGAVILAGGTKGLANCTGQPLERVEKDADRDFFLSAQEALEYGIIDEVLKPASPEKDEAA